MLVDNAQQTFPPKIWFFTESEGDGIESRLLFKIFSTLPIIRIFFQNCNTLHHVDWWTVCGQRIRKKALSPWHYKYSGSSSLYVCLLEIGGQSKRWFAMNVLYLRSVLWETNGFILKFVFSDKATKIDEIFTVDLTLTTYRQ